MPLIDLIQFRFVPTGSLAVEFRSKSIEDITAATIEVTDSALQATVYDELEIIPGNHDKSYAFALLPSLPYGETYNIVATFSDGVEEEHWTKTLALPMPTFSRTSILRQRLFELLLPLENDEIEIYGAIHSPMSVGNDFKADAGVTIEVGVASLDNSQTASVNELENLINIPLNIHAGIGNPDSAARVTEAAEYIWGYLQSIDWHLAGMAIQKERASYQAQDPELDADRKMATVRGRISIPLPVLVS